MDRNIPISEKRGCNKDSLNLILVKDSVDSINKVFTEYFDLKVYSHTNLNQYLKLEKNAYCERKRLRSVYHKFPARKWKKIPIEPSEIMIYEPIEVWRYARHDWSIIFLNSDNDSVAFTFSALLDTDVMTFWESKYAGISEFKLFRQDKLIEHYRFGLECGKLFDNDYWDLIVECVKDPNLFPGIEAEEHKFCSSIRKVTEEEIKLAVDTKRNLLYDRGFLDSCLKYYNAYLPICEETPANYWEVEDVLVLQKWDSVVEQLDIVMRSNYWSYYDATVPQQVSK